MDQHEFLMNHLKRVSRSFSFCIDQLDEPLRRYVAVSYLLCRIVDTIEDAPWLNGEAQQLRFVEFQDFLAGLKICPENWVLEFPRPLPEGELLLLHDAPVIFSELNRCPADIQLALTTMIQSMTQGMAEFARRRSHGKLKLRNLLEVNQYCFFVAGIVGEVLARIVNHIEPKVELTSPHLLNAHHFGQFLQKVNLLKDQIQDEQEGRFLVPDRRELQRSLYRNAWGALDYLLALPLHLKSYRIFCAWSLFLGVATLSASNDGFSKGLLGKLARKTTHEILELISQVIDRPEELKKILAAAIPKEIDLNTESSSVEVDAWFEDSYSGLLDAKQLSALGVVKI